MPGAVGCALVCIRAVLSSSLSSLLRSAFRLVVAHRARVALLFIGVLGPLVLFGALADEVWEREPMPFDVPVLEAMRALHTPARDAFMTAVTKLGYAWGVVPVAVALPLVLAARRRPRPALYAAVALAGTSLLNLGAKAFFGRDRPALWASIAPESTCSFPSGHAMGSMGLVVVLCVLAWPTRARWAVVGLGAVFVLLVGVSRVYLGVHYPSDILAGWAAALAWTLGLSALVRPHRSSREPEEVNEK